jgi:hypothetical protein
LFSRSDSLLDDGAAMAFNFPQFPEPSTIDARRSWTASFDSFDQRNDDAYYVVTLSEDGREAARFMAQIGLSWAGDDWTGPDFVERVQRELHKVAVTGKTNTNDVQPIVPHRG